MSDNVEQRRDILAGVDDLMQRYASEVTRPPKKTVPIPPPSWPGVRDRLSDDLNSVLIEVMDCRNSKRLLVRLVLPTGR